MKKSLTFSLIALATLSLCLNSCDKLHKYLDEKEQGETSAEVQTMSSTTVAANQPETPSIPKDGEEGTIDTGNYYTEGTTVYGTQYDWLSKRYVTYEDICNLDVGQIRVLRNSIYARHGRRFHDSNLQNYFNTQSWYNGYREEVTQSEFNSYEVKNVAFLKRYE